MGGLFALFVSKDSELADARRQTREALRASEVSDSLLSDAARTARTALVRGDSLEQRIAADSARRRVAAIRYAFAVQSAPPECDSVVAAADSVIAAERQRADAEQARAEGYHEALANVAMNIAASQAGFRQLTEAAKKLHDMTRPSPLGRLLPDEGSVIVLSPPAFEPHRGPQAGLALTWKF